MKVKTFLFGLSSLLCISAAEYRDNSALEIESTRRSFKVSADECKKEWELSSEMGISYCAVNIDEVSPISSTAAIVKSDSFKFACSGDSSIEKLAVEILAHGTFGFIVQADGQVSFAKIEKCLIEEIKRLPNQEVSVSFSIVKKK